MFIGHFGVGFGAKSVSPKVSLGSLFLTVLSLDKHRGVPPSA